MTAPWLALHCMRGTFHLVAAAVIINSRTVAPARRSGMKFSLVLLLPPVPRCG
jgi:hypothetical protein